MWDNICDGINEYNQHYEVDLVFGALQLVRGTHSPVQEEEINKLQGEILNLQ